MCLTSIIAAFIDQPLFRYRFIILTLHTIAIIITVYTVIFNRIVITKKKLLLFFVTFLLVTIPRIYLLITYPFVAVGDEIRDGSLDAMKIAHGTILNIFNYGSYGSHGLIIPSFNSIFWDIFHSSVLTYRVPSAIIGVVTLLLFYFLIKKYSGNTIAFISTLIFSSLGLHLFYSRTETVVIFSGLLAILDLIILYQTYKIKTFEKYIIVGLILGFNFNFHASVTTLAFIYIGIFLVNNFKNIYHKPAYLIIFIISLIAGFGPRILFTTQATFLHPSRLGLHLTFNQLVTNYIQSLGVYSFEPTTSHYLTHEPILSPIYSVLLFFGLIFLVFKIKKQSFLIYPLFTIIALPFTNSAITDMINGDHRLLSVLPALCFIIGLGITFISRHLPRLPSTICLTAIFIVTQLNTYQFFSAQKANNLDIFNWRRPLEYLSMHIIYLIKANSSMAKELCIITSPDNVVNYNYLHYQEQYQFFLPEKSITYEINPSLTENTATILAGNCRFIDVNKATLHQFLYQCQPNDLKCPKNYQKYFMINY